MDAYVFASQATETAVTTLSQGVGAGGPARVVCPLTGARALYLAVEGSEETLAERLATIAGMSGLTDVEVYTADGDPFGNVTFPTHALVQVYVGFALLDVVDAEATAALVAVMNAVIGLAVVVGGPAEQLLVELTASTGTALTAAFTALAALDGVTLSFTATGQTSLGTGFPGE